MKAFDLEAEIKIDIANANASLDTLIKKAKELNTELNVPKSAGGGTSGSGTSGSKLESEETESPGVGSVMSVTLGNLSSSAIRAIGSAIKGAISDGFNYNIERESYVATLQTIMNSSKEEAEALFNKLTKISLDTPLNQSSIGYASERLLNFGFPREGLEDMIIDLGNLARGDNEKMERITKALSDTLSKHFLAGQERNQFAEAGIDIWGLLDAYYSSTDKEWASLTDEEKDSEFIFRQKYKLLPASDVVAAIQYASNTPGMPYYNAMELAMDTVGGAMERAGEGTTQYVATLLDESGVMDAAKAGANVVADNTTLAANSIKKLGFGGGKGYAKFLNDKIKAEGELAALLDPFAFLEYMFGSNNGQYHKDEFMQDEWSEELLARAIDRGLITEKDFSKFSFAFTPEEMQQYAATGDMFSLLAPYAPQVLDELNFEDGSIVDGFGEAVDLIPSKVEEGFRGAKVQVTVGTGNIVLDSGMLVGALTPKVNVSLGGLLGNA